MIGPAIGPWTEQGQQFAGLAIPARNIRSLVSVAGGTGERQVPLHGATAVLLGDDVIDPKRKWQHGLRKPAVFTLVFRARDRTLRARSRFTASAKEAAEKLARFRLQNG